MQTPKLRQHAFLFFGRMVAIALLAVFSIHVLYSQSAASPTTINITDTAKLTNAKRIGLVLGNQDFYDSGQFMRNLSFRNPGFEGEIWQTIFHCQYVTATTCTDDDLYTYWPANFMANGKAEFIVGAATGQTTTIESSTAASIGKTGVVLTFPALATPPAVGDYLVVRTAFSGNAQAGWWPQGTSGTQFTTEYADLSPNTPGKQALRITQGASDKATLASFMDSTAGRSFVQLNGAYTLTFRAKSTGGSNQVNIGVERAVTAPPGVSFFNQTVALSTGWQDYQYTFTAKDTGRVGSLSLKFTLTGGSMLIDDVALTAAAASDNPTVYRNEVVTALRNLKPGILRFMDSGTDWGSTIDNMLQPDFVRRRAGYSNVSAEMDDIPLNLHDYLVLCQTIGAEPWYTMPTGMSTQEVSDLMDYLGGSTSTVYGARREALGQAAAWTTVFPKIHLEFGNEVWNTSNPGASMNDALSYGKRAGVIFTTAKQSPSYNAKIFDLIQDGMEANPYWTQQGLSTSTNYDTVDSTAYVFSNLNDTSSTEAIYGPMFAEPEFLDSTAAGQMSQMAAVAAAAKPPARLSVYEMNMGTNQGSATQAFIDSSVAGAGSGIAVGVNSLLLMRDLGITDQNMFALQGLTAPFHGSNSNAATSAPIWGIVVDMGGATNLKRPVYLTQMMTNNAILPTLLSTSQTGANPTWNQPYTTNDDFSLTGAHYIQSFAFTDGNKLNIVLFNLSRTTALPINFAGLNTPLGAAAISTLSSPSISASNETTGNVTIKNITATLTAGTTLMLPAFSMSTISIAKPVIPVVIKSLTASCANASLSPGESTTCTATVVGQGKYNATVNWAVDSGTIDANGRYTAPSTIPASGKATISATSAQDATKKATITVLIANNAITSVTASCAAASVGEGQTLACTAKVNGTGGFSPALTWTTTAGSILANGTITAPTIGTNLTVKATSTQDPTKSGSVTLAVTPFLILGPPNATTTSTTATISWTTNLAAHGGISYGPTQALGLGTPYAPNATTAPSFTLTGLKPGTTYYMSVYSFMNGQTASEPYTITTATGTSTVSAVSLSCAATTVTVGATTTCTPKVTGTGSFSSAVTWSASAGSITAAGVLTAPATASRVTVKATSTQDTTKSATISIAVSTTSAVAGVSVSCSPASVVISGTTACQAKVTGTGSFSSAVAWSTSAGSITSAGVLTAPAAATTVTVKAISAQDTSKAGAAAVTVAPVLAIQSPMTSVSSSSVTVGWTLTAGAHSGVSYGPTSSLGSGTPYDPTVTASPKYTLTGLKPSTTYTLVIFSFMNGQSVSNSLTATTAAK